MDKKSLMDLISAEEIALHELGLCKLGEDKTKKNRKILKDVFSRGILSGTRLHGEHYGYESFGGLQYYSAMMMARATLGYLTGVPTEYDEYFKIIGETKYGQLFLEELKEKEKQLKEFLKSEGVVVTSPKEIDYVSVIDNPTDIFNDLTLLGLVNKYFGLNLISSTTPKEIKERLDKRQKIYIMHGGVGIFHYIPKDGRTIYHLTIQEMIRPKERPFISEEDLRIHKKNLNNPLEINIIGQIFPEEFVAVLVDEEGIQYKDDVPQHLPVYYNAEGQIEFKLI